MKTITDPSGNTVSYNYNESLGTLTSVTDSKKNTTYYDQYDSDNRLLHVYKTADGKKVENSYTYDKDKISTITTNGFNYSFGYDTLGNNTTVSVGAQNLATNDYDYPTGNLKSSVFGNGQRVDYQYDNQTDRLINKYYDGSSNPSFSYQYDAAGNLGCLQDFINGMTTRYVYDNANRLVKINETDQASGNTNTLSYDYDKNNNTNKITDTIINKNNQKNCYITSYSYDKDNNMTSVTNNNNDTISYLYDQLSRISNKNIKTSAGSFSIGYSYMDGAPITGVSSSTTSKVKEINYNTNEPSCSYSSYKQDYTYDENGNIETSELNHVLYIAPSKYGEAGQKNIYDKKNRYYYNELNELTREDNQALDKTITYEYDAGGNISSKKEYSYTTGDLGTQTPASTINYGYDATWKDKLTSYNGNQITYASNGTDIGNPLTYNGWIYNWEHGRQLKGISGNGYNISYKYNDSGIRTQKVVNGVTTTYRLVGNKVTYESDGTDSIYYTYDSEGKLVSMNLNGVEYYYVRDVQKDIVGLLDKGGSQVVSYTYDSWGKLISIDGSLKDTVGVKNPYRYRGYRYDTETGLYYLESRYYNPEWGRFINADAIAGSTGDLLSHNVFAYCKNDPVNNCDPDGFSSHRTTIDYEEMNRLAHAQPAYHSSRRSASRRKSTALRRKNSRISDAFGFIATVENVHKTVVSSAGSLAGLLTEENRAVSAYAYAFTTPWAIASHVTDPYLSTNKKWIACGLEILIAGVGIVGIAAIPGGAGVAAGIAYSIFTTWRMDKYVGDCEKENGK